MSDSSTKIPSPSKGTILVVEDDEVVAALEKRHLERAGYTVEVVGNGEKAMERLRQGGIDLAVLDYQLPGGKTGLDFYHEIKQVGIDLPIIVVTGFNDETTVITALRAGVRDFITKSKQYLDYLPEAVERVLAQEKTKHALVQSEIELKLSSSLLRSTLEATADGILVVDSTGKIADFNTHFVEMWDIPAEILQSKDDQKAIQFVLNQLTHPEEFSAKVQELYSRPLEKSPRSRDMNCHRPALSP